MIKRAAVFNLVFICMFIALSVLRGTIEWTGPIACLAVGNTCFLIEYAVRTRMSLKAANRETTLKP